MKTFVIKFTPWRWEDLEVGHGKGALVRDMGSHACWWYYVQAQRHFEKMGKSIDDQIILEGTPWLDDSFYEKCLRRTAEIYGVEIDHLNKFWPQVKMTAMLLGLPEPNEKYIIYAPKKRLVV